jgi:NAD(P)H-hydrate epimerase
MHKVVTIDEMRALERGAEEAGLPSPALMENAGRAVADVISRRYPVGAYPRTVVIAGPGNNGGDGLVAARHLADGGYRVTLYTVSRPETNGAKERLLRQRAVPFIDAGADAGLVRLETLIASSDLILDAVFGTGRLRPIVDPVAAVLQRVNDRQTSAPVVALDLPSGAHADTGEADPSAIRATLTVTLGQPKRGLFQRQTAILAGEITVADIGVPDDLAATFPIGYADAESVSRMLPARPSVSHKGTFGRALVIAGSRSYTGAPVLAALGAARIGAGLVTIACPASVRDSLATHALEVTYLPVPDDGTGAFQPGAVDHVAAAALSYDAVLIGPGIGRLAATRQWLVALLGRLRQSGKAVVLDADALTLLSEEPEWWGLAPPNSIVTPHPGEMSRLLGGGPTDARIEVATDSAKRWGVTVVLKGAYTIVAGPGGQAIVLPFAESSLATAGTGDVLAGATLGLATQGLGSFDSAVAAGFVHGEAGRLLARDFGSAGGLASDLADRLPRAARDIRGIG